MDIFRSNFVGNKKLKPNRKTKKPMFKRNKFSDIIPTNPAPINVPIPTKKDICSILDKSFLLKSSDSIRNNPTNRSIKAELVNAKVGDQRIATVGINTGAGPKPENPLRKYAIIQATDKIAISKKYNVSTP